jgi:Domain of unknown function (DUF4062)
MTTVMISSTFEDLKEHRRKALDACHRLGFQAKAQEYTSAADLTTLAKSLQMVDASDALILIVGVRYGTVPDGETESITVQEYRRARERGIPCFIFMMSDNHPTPRIMVETGPGASKLEAFRQELRDSRKVRRDFDDAESLKSAVLESLLELDRTPERDGSSQLLAPRAPEPWAAHPYVMMQSKLVGRKSQLKKLDRWAQTADEPVIVLHAIGGMGKSALTWRWFREQGRPGGLQYAGAIWWSFYEAEAGFANFVLAALGYITGVHRADLEKLSHGDRLDRLCHALGRKRYLLVLDGFERELQAYARLDASYLDDQGAGQNAFKRGAQPWRPRKAIDSRVGDFLRVLASLGTSKVLISSRLFPADLESATGLPLPGVISEELNGLTDEEASELWEELQVRGSREALSRLFSDIDGYPLLVTAMAGLISNYKRAPGDFDTWSLAHPDFNPASLELKSRKTFILEYALKSILMHVRYVLETIAAFRMPVQYRFLLAVLVGHEKLCADEMALISALEELGDRGLLGWNRGRNTYDLHPIVRNVVWTKVTQSDRSTIYRAIQSEFETIPAVEGEIAKSLDDLFVPMELVRLCIEQERFDYAFDVYYNRLYKPLGRLGLYEKQVELISPLFPNAADPKSTELAVASLGEYARREGSLWLAIAKKWMGETDTALRLLEYHNRLCTNRICRMHQIYIFKSEFRINKSEVILKEILTSIHSPRVYELDRLETHEFYCLHFIGNALCMRGEVRLAEVAVARQCELGADALVRAEVGPERTQEFILGAQLLLQMAKGEFVFAAELAKKSVNVARSACNNVWLFDDLMSYFDIHLRLGDLDAAGDDLEEIHDLARGLGGASAGFDSEMAMARLLRALGNLDGAQDALESITRRLAERVPPADRARLQREVGTLAGARRNIPALTAAAEAVLDIACASGDCPRGLEDVEWALTALGTHKPAAAMRYNFPPGVSWTVEMIDPSLDQAGVTRH